MLGTLKFDKERPIVYNNREETLENLRKTCSKETVDWWEKAKIKDVLEEMAPGIYEFFDCNDPEYLLDGQELKSFEHANYERACKLKPFFKDLNPFEGTWVVNYPYGVCDNYQQILNRVKGINEYINDKDNTYVIILYKVKKSEQPETGGWRWHKWGPYIGDHEITTEYLYDEDDIDFVYTFSIYRIIN